MQNCDALFRSLYFWDCVKYPQHSNSGEKDQRGYRQFGTRRHSGISSISRFRPWILYFFAHRIICATTQGDFSGEKLGVFHDTLWYFCNQYFHQNKHIIYCSPSSVQVVRCLFSYEGSSIHEMWAYRNSNNFKRNFLDFITPATVMDVGCQKSTLLNTKQGTNSLLLARRRVFNEQNIGNDNDIHLGLHWIFPTCCHFSLL